MERMGDILARTARSRVRRGRISAAQPTQPTRQQTAAQASQPAQSAQPPEPTQTRPTAPPAHAIRPSAAVPLEQRGMAPRVARPTTPIGRRPARAPLSTPAADVVHRAIPPADALGATDDLDTLDSERILELPSKPALSAPRAARVTAPLVYAETPMSNGMLDGMSDEPPARRAPIRRASGGRTQSATLAQSGVAISRMSAGSSGMLSLGEATQSYARALRPKGPGANAANGRRAAAQPASVPAPSDDPDICPLCHGAGYVRLDVPVGDPAFGQAVACACKERLLEDRRMSDLRRMSSLDAFRDKTFATFDTSLPGVREALEVARRYAEDPHGWLVLSGGYGVGKTHLAAAIAHERLASGQSVFFSIVPDLLDHLRAAFAPSSEMPYDELFDKVREAGVLVLDDLGAENATAWATEKLFQIINYRYNYRMPTVITTNHRLLSHMDERIRSRLSDRSFVRNVAIDSADYRERHAGRPPRQSGQPGQTGAARGSRGAYQR